MNPGIRVARDDDIATVSLDNPGKLNALTLAMWKDLASAMRDLSADASLRCVVLREILLEGPILGAGEAHAKGLVTRVVPERKVEEETYATARRIAAGAPLVARWHKQYVQRLMPPVVPLNEAEIEANFAHMNTEDYRIGRQAFLAKIKPKFVGR